MPQVSKNHDVFRRLLVRKLANNEPLSRRELDELYFAVDSHVRSVTRKYFQGNYPARDARQRLKKQDDHLDRIVLFYEYLSYIYERSTIEQRESRGVGFYLSAYRRRFVELETVLELRTLGVYTPIDKVRSPLINWFAKVKSWQRAELPAHTENEIMGQWQTEWIRLNKRLPNQATIDNARRKVRWFMSVESKRNKISLDAVPSWMSPL